MKIRLIEPGNARQDPFAQCWYTPEQGRFTVPLLALPVLASLTPPRHQVEIVDEKVREVDLDADCDLACFSFKTKDAKRTYRYAQAYRQRGVPVVFGGVHATCAPEEAAPHADSVVIGEAEGIWHQVIADCERGQLRKRYVAPKGVPLDTAPIPRFELLDHERYAMHAVQTSRGCLVGCEFCPVQRMHGGSARHKPVPRVLDEVRAVRNLDPDKLVFFVDEMFCGGETAYQKELLAALRRERTEFFCITDFKVISPAYVRDLARSGCRKMSINMPGTCLPQELKAIRSIQRLGIDVWGFFMFGFSFHDRTVFQKVETFVRESGMKHLTLTVMTPFPNTPMAQQLAARGVKPSEDLDLYDQCHVTFEPERMSARELEEGFHWAWRQLEPRFHFREDAFSGNGKRSRFLRRAYGTAVMKLEHGLERLRPRPEAPVDLLRIVGKPKVEVSVTTYNAMGGYHVSY